MTGAPSGPVDHVESTSVTGAKIMHGTWPDDETAVLISPADPYDVVDAALAADANEL